MDGLGGFIHMLIFSDQKRLKKMNEFELSVNNLNDFSAFCLLHDFSIYYKT